MSIQRLSNAGQSGYRYKSLIAGITPVASVPTIGDATALTYATASVAFTAPGAYAGSTYTATSSPGGFTGTSATSPIIVSGLSEQTSYTFTVTATNATGTSGPSAASNSITTPSSFSPAGAYDALASVTLSANASSIEFANIPSGYRHLQIRGINRDAQTNTNINSLYLSFNGDVTSNGSWKRMEGFGSGTPTVQGYATAGALWIGPSSTNGYSSNIFSSHIIDILDYRSENKYKVIKHFGGFDTNGTGTEPGEVNLTSGLWMSLSPVTSISLLNSSYNQVANTSFTLYGIK